MPLKFIFGPSGSGKSYHLYHHVIDESKKNPEQNYIVLVPEQFTMQTQKDLVTMHPDHGIMNIDVLSFGRLAYRVFEETGDDKLPVLDDEGKNLILRKIAGDYEEELKVLKGNIRKLGYISEVKSVISEFTQYDIGEEELERVMEHVGEHSKLYYKLRDIQILYRGFTEYLSQKYITKEELLDVLSRAVPKSKLLKNTTIVLDGFTGFTPVQERLIAELLKYCRKVIVTVTMEEKEDPFVYRHPYQLFALSKQMVTSLVEVAKNVGEKVEDSQYIYDKPVYRFQNNEPLAFLESNIFRYEKNVYEKEQKAIQMFVARNPREEAFLAAGKIRALVRTQNLRYREIGVIVSDMDTYGDYLEQAFRTYEIPVFMDHKRSILLNPFVEYIRSILNMAQQNFSYESVFRFLRTNLSGYSYEDVDKLENYVIGMGIKGYKKWQERWIRHLDGMEEEELAEMNHLRVLLVEKVDPLMFVLRQRKKTVKDITVAVYEFMVREELQQKLAKQEEQFQVEGELALAKEYAQIYRILIELFDKFVNLLGEEQVGLQEYCRLLDAGLEEARVGVIPPGVDQVVVGDVERTRLKDIQALFFVGANDAFLPGNLLRTGLLTERDREQFQCENLSLAPGGKERAYVQKFYLYMNLTKPSKELHVSYSKVSADGKTMRPSYLVQELERLYPKLSVQDADELLAGQKELTEKVGVDYLIQGFRQEFAGTDLVWNELYSWYLKHPHWKKKTEQLLQAGFYCKPMDGMSKAIAKELYGDYFETSITRMERFSSCAFAHFLTYGLKLKERQEYEFQALDLGNVCHRALECYSEKLQKMKLSWTEISQELQQEYIAESVEKAIVDYGNSVLYSSARNEAMIARMKQLMERTVWALTHQLARGDFQPSQYEVRFQGGKIDRIDLCEDEEKLYVKVLDYKTGSKKFDVVALYYGLQLQLMVYMNAAIELEQKKYPKHEIIPAGVFYYQIQDPYVDKVAEAQIEKDLLKAHCLDGMIHLKDEVLRHLEHCAQGESLAVPVKYNKNGTLSKNSKTASEEEFRLMMQHARKKVDDIRGEILEGVTTPVPYRKGQETGCDYCKYRHICGFDLKIPGFHYREIQKMNQSEAFAKMKAYVEKEV